MPVQTSYPGVYVQEVPSGVRTIAAVSTSTAMFIGRARMGPLNEPVQCLNYSDFVREFSDQYAGSDLARAVKLFFLNGGTQCYVMRIAQNAVASAVTLKYSSADGAEALRITAKSAGVIGDTTRLRVTYGGNQPEATFNLEVFRWETDSAGQAVKADMENWQGLSMDPLHSRYAPTYISQNSKLVDAEDRFTLPAPTPAPALQPGFSVSGRPLPRTAANFRTALQSALDIGKSFRISVNGVAFVNVDLIGIDLTATPANIVLAIQQRINDNLPSATPVTVTLVAGPSSPATTDMLRIESATGDVFIEPAPTNDIATALMLGSAQGGLEVPRYSAVRPVPNGVVFATANLVGFANRPKTAFDVLRVDTTDISLTGAYSLNIGGPGFMYQDAVTPVPSITGNNNGVREKFAIIADAINNKRANNPLFRWSAQLWGSRLALLPEDGPDNSIGTISTSGGGGVDIGGDFVRNVRHYSLGTAGAGGFQVNGVAGNDGHAPQISDYTNAFSVINKEVDLFNLLILPGDAGHVASTTAGIYGAASVFCQERRAFLLMDPPIAWVRAQVATNPTTGVNSLRVGLVKDHSAVFYPRVTIKENGLDVNVGPSGAIAGLIARIDASRGVWKAPAGTEADLRGVYGLEYRFSDGENGVLNRHAINAIRIFPNGIVNWGARTMAGDDDFASEWKYISVRRTALFIEESLYRGLKWVVFEPNDEPLWSQIRLNVGAFMHDLFRQGAFQGKTRQEAYFVKCDAETTTQNDINLGRVNIWVGFAPLKPAEFVILYLQQMTGQVQV